MDIKETPNLPQNMTTARNYRIIYYKFRNQLRQSTIIFTREKTGKNITQEN